MNAISYQQHKDLFPHLSAWFRYRSSRHSGFKRLEHLFHNDNQQPKSVATLPSDYSPLTTAEEQRWQSLERRAKQENLSGQDSAEYEILLEIKLYNRYKSQHPQLSHEHLVSFIKKML